MIYLVRRSDKKILAKCDAWLQNGEQWIRDKATELGYKVVDWQITMMGDMLMFAEQEA